MYIKTPQILNRSLWCLLFCKLIFVTSTLAKAELFYSVGLVDFTLKAFPYKGVILKNYIAVR